METESEKLTLELALKITGSFPILFGVLMPLTPSSMMEGFGVDVTEGMKMFAVYMGLLMILFGVAHWLVAMNVVENINMFAKFFAAGHFSFILGDLYNYSTDVLPMDAANIGNNVFTMLFVVILLMKSRD